MLTVPQAAREVGRNPETVRRWIREGRLPATRVGTQHLIAEDDLVAAAGARIRDGYPRAVDHQGASSSRVGDAAARYMVDPHPPVDPWLPAIVGRFVRLVDPVRVVLFGSRAGATAAPGSDYDLLVELDHVEHARRARIDLGRSIADLPVAVDIVVADSGSAPSPTGAHGVVATARREGRTVYERRQ